MEKFIFYEKLSKKEKRKIDQARRQTWGQLNPVTRKPENKQGIQQKEVAELEAGATAYRAATFFLTFSLFSLTIS